MSDKAPITAGFPVVSAKSLAAMHLGKHRSCRELGQILGAEDVGLGRA